MKKNIVTSAVVYIAGSVFVQGLTFITLPVFARILSPSDFGIYASYTFWIMLNTILVSIQLNGTINNAYIDFGEKRLYGYVLSVSGSVLAAFLILLGVTTLLKEVFESLFELKYYVLVLGLIQCLFLFYVNSLSGIYRILEEPFKYFILSAVNAAFNIALSILLSIKLSSEKYLGRVYGASTITFIFGVISFIIIYRKGKKSIFPGYITYGLRFSCPLIFHGIASIIMNRLDQMMILKLISSTEAGIYSFGANFGHIIYVLYSASNMAFIPWYYKKIAQNKKEEVVKISLEYMALGTLATTIIVLLLPEIIKFMASPQYYYAIYSAPLISVAYFFGFLYTFPVDYEFFYKKTKLIATGTIMSALINVIGNYYFIPRLGSIGAAATTILAYFFLLCLHFLFAKYRLRGYELSAWPFVKNILYILAVLTAYYFALPFTLMRCICAVVCVFMMLKRICILKTREGI